jgi:hypothetical protein
MATVEEIIKDIQALAPMDLSMPACARWLDNRYKELVARVNFSNLRKVGELSVPGIITTGTISATRGSTAITGVATTFQTEIGSGTQEHYWLRTLSAWYRIASVSGELALTLASAFAEDDVSGATYQIVKRTHSLASDVRWTGKFVMPRVRRKIDTYSRDEFDISFPGRTIAGRWPEAVCQDGVDSSGYVQVELYPPPNESELIAYVYWSLPSALTITSTIPAQIDGYVLKEGTMIDVYRWAKVKQIEKGNVEAASVYANEEAKQRTVWERKILDAIRTQRGTDDLTFILESFGGRRSASDITTAREHILAGWRY